MSVVLVTGGAGYVGSHACKALAAAGHTPVVYDNLERGHRWAVKWGPLEVGDVRDGTRLDAVFARHRPEAVLHFAAYAYVGESVAEPLRYYDNNFFGSLSLLEAMRRHGVAALVFSSSCTVYGLPRSATIAEDHPRVPVSPYGHGKLAVERMLEDSVAWGLRSCALRYFNAAGADPDGETGEVHDPETHLIPNVLAGALDGSASLTVHGDDYATADGTCVRDYIHVTDLADAHVRALQRLANRNGFEAFNLGTGRGYSVKEVIAAAERVCGRTIPRQIGPRRPGDPDSLVAKAERANRELGWQPRYSGLDTILRTAWAWTRRDS